MMAERWTKAKKILADAFEFPSAERAAFVQQSCVGDPELLSIVKSLVQETDIPDHFLRTPSTAPGTKFVEAVLEQRNVGARVGPYELIECLGSGGMGTIYRARRADDEYDTEVAVKLIKTGSLSSDSLRRFQHERQTLANLDHPNIARLLDGGTAEDGSPYLVMQYIDGIPIDRYCDENSLSTIQRLELFRKVCAAVQHAHQNLVVHRDLKPKNILVTPQGKPVLLDFGISKWLEENEADARDRTMTAMRIMTPQYASPEQLRGDPIATASDVYSLGVILYEILTGHRPYRIHGRESHDAARVVSELEPETPSDVVQKVEEIDLDDGTTGTITPESVGARRGERPERLRRQLRGDLDTIVLTAMHKDPARRYSSVEQFSEDINRHLTGLPVRAQRDTFVYKAKKFIGRNKAVVIASAVALICLVGGTIGTSIGFFRAREALVEARLQTNKAEAAARTTKRVNAFLQEMLSYGDPYVAPRDTTVVQLLDAISENLDAKWGDQPGVLVTAHQVLSLGFLRRGFNAKAEKHARIALQIATQESDDSSPETVLLVNDLALSLRAQGRYLEAQELYERSLDEVSHLPGDNQLLMATLQANLAGIHRAIGAMETAESLCLQALSIRSRTLGDNHVETLMLKNNLAQIISRLGRLDESARLHREVLAERRSVLSANNPAIGDSLNNLAFVLERAGKYSEAETLHRDALSIYRAAFGETHAHVARSLNNLASCQRRLGHLDKSEESYRTAIETVRLLSLPDPTLLATCLNNLASLLVAVGQLEEASSLHRDALEIRQRVLGPTHSETLSSQNNVGMLLIKKGAFTEAKEVLLEVLRGKQATRGPDDASVARTLLNLSAVAERQEDFPEATRYAREALDIFEKTIGAEHPDSADAFVVLGAMLMKQKQFAEALGLIERGRTIRRERLPDTHRLVNSAESLLGACLLELGQHERAEEILTSRLAFLRDNQEIPKEQTENILRRMIDLYEAWNKPEEAAEYRAMLPASDVRSAEPSQPSQDGRPAVPDNGDDSTD